jgi:hypothetical protein
MAKSKAATEDEKLLAEAKANYKLAEEAWADNRKYALEDMKFRAGDQWPADIKKKREAEGLPCLTVDKLNQYVRQIVNDGRQNRPASKVRPIDDKGDVQVAEAFQGLIRHICKRSRADQAFDTALEHAVVGGFGFFRILTEYAHENTFNQEIKIKRVSNPLSVLLDPNAREADGSDCMFGFVVEDVPKEKFKKLYPKASATDWTDSGYSDGWSDEHNIRRCEYFYKVEVPTTLHLLADGTSVTEEAYQRSLAELGPEGVPPIEQTREITTHKVKWCRMSGAEILEKNDWLGKFIPIIPVYGEELNVDGKVTYRGIIRPAKDPAMLYNFSRSAFAQRVALTPKAPWLIAEGQIEGHETEWENANSGNVSALVYKAADVEGRPIPPPSRISPTDVPAGFSQDMQLAEHDIQGSIGMYNASLGEQSNEKSGKAIMARQREGDVATFHYPDNLNRAIDYMSLQLVDLAPKVWDSRRLIRLLGEDGSITDAYVDPELGQAVEKRGKDTIYNLSVGIYDVSVETGPSYTTRRVESAEGMIAMAQANPQAWLTHGDLIAKAQDWPNAEEFAKRSRLTLPPEIRQAVEAEDASEDPEVAAMRAQMQQLEQEAQQAIQEREALLMEAQKKIEELQRQDELKAQELQLKEQENQIKMFDAQTKRQQAENSALEARQSTVDEAVNSSLQATGDVVAEERNSTSEAIHAMLTGINGLTGAVERVAGAVEVVQGQVGMVQDQMDMVQGQVQELAEEAAAPIAYGRDEQGRVSSVTKGKRTRTVKRGPDGKVAGVQ